MPLTVGPGSISVAITLGANPPRELRSLFTTALAHVIGVFIVAVSIYLCYRYADRILNKLGRTGTNVLIRLSAFILFCIGVQIMWNGLQAMLSIVIHGVVGRSQS
jgi:multiple antibiotic resistance protein